MANLQKVIKVTQSQYNILASGGRVGDYVGLDDRYIYMIEDTNEYITRDDIGVLSYIETMTILNNSVAMPAGTTVENNNVAFPEGVTVTDHNIIL